MAKKWEMPGTWQEPDSVEEVPSPTPGQDAANGISAFGVNSYEAARTTAVDPAVSEKQRKFFGAVLGRKRAGRPRKSDPDVTEAQASEFARKRKR